MQKNLPIMLIYMLLLGLLFWPAVSGLALEVPPLTAEDCQKCHTTEVQQIAEAGGKHRDLLTCVDCHQEHPPRGANAIPACALCHDPTDQRHFSVSDCLGCHNPHTPLRIDYSNALRVAPACASCHTRQAAEFRDYPSNHSLLDCKDCHQQHGKFLSCLNCHAPHLKGQTYADCRQCHQPHAPLKVVYSNTLGSDQCAACHVQEGKNLKQITTKHRLLLCVYCHKSQHKRMPKCETCHFKPHDAGIHKKFPDCKICHVGPHKLIN